jgi:hypothetical protein
MSEIKIYTDGASRGNPGPGGYGAILMFGNHRKELSKGYRLTTNNRMELMSYSCTPRIKKREPSCNNLFRQPIHSKYDQ